MSDLRITPTSFSTIKLSESDFDEIYFHRQLLYSSPHSAVETSDSHLTVSSKMNAALSNSVWNAMNYTPPRGRCNYKSGIVSGTCSCLRFMLHPVKV